MAEDTQETPFVKMLAASGMSVLQIPFVVFLIFHFVFFIPQELKDRHISISVTIRKEGAFFPFKDEAKMAI